MRRILIALALVIAIPLALVAGAVVLVQSEWTERWLERQLASRIERDVVIEGVDLDFGWPPAVKVRRLRIANPAWATTPDLVDAEGLYARVAVPPLFKRRLVVPYLGARAAVAGLERDGNRATWRFGGDEQKPSPIHLGRVYLDRGRIFYRDEDEKTALDIDVAGSLGREGELKLSANGRFRGEPAKGSARIPALEPSPDTPVRLIADATIGKTRVGADGTLAAGLDSLDFRLQLAGQTLKDLRTVFGMNLPDTPPYRIEGRLRHAEDEWIFDPFHGKVGDSDLGGSLAYRTGGKRPFLQASLESKLLDFDDLGPLVGAPPKTRPGETASPKQKRKAAEMAAKSQALPREKFSTERWDDMDADVRLEAKRVLRPKALPIDALSTHVLLENSLLRLDPLSFGVAGGRVSAKVALDARVKPVRGEATFDVQGLKLARLFAGSEKMKQALGTVYGRGKLTGRGESVGDLLGTSSGEVVVAVDGGQVSLLLIELLGLDLAESLQLLGTRNRQVTLRCAISELSVKDGVAAPQAFVVDTSDTVVNVDGTIDFASERLDLVTYPEPKDMSIFALRSPITVRGPLRHPAVRPKAGPIVARGIAAIVLGAVNPALALIPFIETGPGKDSDCARLLAEAKSKGAVRKER